MVEGGFADRSVVIERRASTSRLPARSSAGSVPAVTLFAVLLGGAPVAVLAQEAEGLNGVPPYTMSYGLALSGDGSTAVGTVTSGGLPEGPFRWTADGTELLDGGLGFSAGGPVGVSQDGGVVVWSGARWNGNETEVRALQWTEDGGTEILTLGAYTGSTTATGVSRDGTVVIGTLSDGVIAEEAVRWKDGGIEKLGLLDPANANARSIARTLSEDGSVIAGQSVNAAGEFQAFQWREGSGISALPFLAASAGQYSDVYDMSADGSVIVGMSTNASSSWEAVKWTDGVAAGLGFLGGASGSSKATGVSRDGTTIIGDSTNSSGGIDFQQAFVWREGSGMVALDGLVGPESQVFQLSFAKGLSADGSVIVGSAYDADYYSYAVVWNAEGDVTTIRSLVEAAGSDLTGWDLTEAVDVSDDGRVILGNGTDADGLQQAWIYRAGALITPNGVAESFASLAAVPLAEANAVDATLNTQFELASQQCAPRADGQPSRYCIYAVGLAGYESGSDGTALQGTVGVAFDFGSAFSAGIAFEAGKGENDLFNGGSYEREAYGGSVYLAHAPDLGFQFVASTTASSLDLDVTRGYFSGNTPVASHSDTDGTAYGVGARIGWRFAPSDNTRLTPFASYTASRVEIDGWTEGDGPFPAEFGDLDQTAQITRVGAEGRLIYMPGGWLWGSAAWGHRLDGDGARVDGELVGLFGLTIPGAALDDNWLELAAGIRQAVGSGGVLTASITTAASVDDMPQATGRIGISQRF